MKVTYRENTLSCLGYITQNMTKLVGLYISLRCYQSRLYVCEKKPHDKQWQTIGFIMLIKWTDFYCLFLLCLVKFYIEYWNFPHMKEMSSKPKPGLIFKTNVFQCMLYSWSAWRNLSQDKYLMILKIEKCILPLRNFEYNTTEMFLSFISNNYFVRFLF